MRCIRALAAIVSLAEQAWVKSDERQGLAAIFVVAATAVASLKVDKECVGGALKSIGFKPGRRTGASR
jgi:hypothetical protein